MIPVTLFASSRESFLCLAVSVEDRVDGGGEELGAGGFAAGQDRFQAGDLRQKVS
jgi:hypothetical protein